jgi:hypothetical protein
MVTFYRCNVVRLLSIQASFRLTHLCVTAICVRMRSIQILRHARLCLAVTSLTEQIAEHEVYFNVAPSLSNKQQRRKYVLISLSTSYRYADHSGRIV